MNKKINVVFWNEGTFIPIRSGGNYFKYNFLRYLNRHTNLTIINATRNYRADSRNTCKLGLKIIHIPPFKYYADITYANSFMKNVDVIMFNDAVNILQVGLKLKHLNPSVKVGYEAHNIDYQLFTELKFPPEMILYQKQIEQQALCYSDFIFVRSKKDKEDLAKLDRRFIDKIVVGKSGICDEEISNNYSERKWHKKILFLGHLNYAPNRIGVQHIIDRIAPKVYKFDPTIEFSIWGVGMNPDSLPKNVNVKFMGYAKNLKLIMKECDIALCPITEGSGTRIKILDYLAHGIPTITTTKGIEGLEDGIDDVVILEDNIDKYGDIIIDFYRNKNKSQLCALSRKGISYVKKHRSWSRLINAYVKTLEGL